MIKIKSHKIVLLDSIFDGFIYIENGKIVEVSKEDKPTNDFFDYSSFYVAPGFIEMHSHGGGGHPFLNGTADDVVEACNFHLKHGTTSILPTITAAPFEEMKKATSNIVEATKSKKLKSNILGVHLEGPYLSKKQSGAQNLEYIKAPSGNEYLPFIKEYGEYIRKLLPS